MARKQTSVARRNYERRMRWPATQCNHIRLARPDNPYGWPKQMEAQERRWDHGTPGEWNAFRQCFNGPNGERCCSATVFGFEGVKLSPDGGPANRQVLYANVVWRPLQGLRDERCTHTQVAKFFAEGYDGA